MGAFQGVAFCRLRHIKTNNSFRLSFFSVGEQPVSGVIAADFYKRYSQHRFFYITGSNINEVLTDLNCSL